MKMIRRNRAGVLLWLDLPSKKQVLFVFGTRPEAIKLAPVVRFLREDSSRFEVRVCVTAQHRELLDRVLETFEIQPDFDLDAMRPGQTLTAVTARILAGLEPVLEQWKPDLVIVQGDTTTTFCGALAAFYRNIPVAHVEAGLRTGDLRQPFPEELNRVLTGKMTALHLAATVSARDNLLREGVPAEKIAVTGNSGIDAVLYVRDRLERGIDNLGLSFSPERSKKVIVVTAHRRESFGEGMANIAEALARLAKRGDFEIVYPVHPNPNVTGPIEKLRGLPNIHLLPPQDYVPFVDLMRRAYFLLTDSGGIQEEGPSLGKPILVMREKTERPEAVEAGTVELVGTDVQKIVESAEKLLDPEEYARRSRIHNPYGDGHASRRIRSAIVNFFAGTPMTDQWS